jgi:hypothetical protein
MTTKPRKPVLPNVVLACMLLVPPLYVLSYAPAVRIQAAREVSVPTLTAPLYLDGDLLPAYRPVDWLIDNTPLRRPLLWWAGVWGVEGHFELSAVFRNSPFRNSAP